MKVVKKYSRVIWNSCVKSIKVVLGVAEGLLTAIVVWYILRQFLAIIENINRTYEMVEEEKATSAIKQNILDKEEHNG